MAASNNSEHFDVIVVGAGPAGSAAALVTARAGLKVLLIERGEYPGAKNVSGAVLYGSAILHQLIPNWWEQAPVERHVTRRELALLSPTTSVSLDFQSVAPSYVDPPFNGFTVLRPKFDRWFAEQAKAAGAFVLNGTVVDDVLREKDQIAGVRTRREAGDIRGDVVIACDGVNSWLARKVGLQRQLRTHELALGVKEVVGLDESVIRERFHLTGSAGMAREYIGDVTGSVHGGAFLYTNRNSLSLGVISQLSSLVEQKQRPYDLLEGFKAHPSVAPLVRGGTLREYSAHLIPEAGYSMIPKLFTNGMMVAGDAAGLCLSTGIYIEGINYAIQSGRAAGDAAIAACERRDFSRDTLSNYLELLRKRHVAGDFHAYRHAPDFVNSERLQNLYPELAARASEALFRVDGNRKRKLLPLGWRTMREVGGRPHQVLKDLYHAGRAYLW